MTDCNGRRLYKSGTTNRARTLRRPVITNLRASELRHLLNRHGEALIAEFPNAAEYLRDLTEWYFAVPEDRG